jgi:hypothetical protein
MPSIPSCRVHIGLSAMIISNRNESQKISFLRCIEPDLQTQYLSLRTAFKSTLRLISKKSKEK